MLSQGELELIHRIVRIACKFCTIPLDCHQSQQQGFILKKPQSKWKVRTFIFKTCINICGCLFPFIRVTKAWNSYEATKDLGSFLYVLILLNIRAGFGCTALSVFLFSNQIAFKLNNILGLNTKYGKYSVYCTCIWTI